MEFIPSDVVPGTAPAAAIVMPTVRTHVAHFLGYVRPTENFRMPDNLSTPAEEMVRYFEGVKLFPYSRVIVVQHNVKLISVYVMRRNEEFKRYSVAEIQAAVLGAIKGTTMDSQVFETAATLAYWKELPKHTTAYRGKVPVDRLDSALITLFSDHNVAPVLPFCKLPVGFNDIKVCALEIDQVTGDFRLHAVKSAGIVEQAPLPTLPEEGDMLRRWFNHEAGNPLIIAFASPPPRSRLTVSTQPDLSLPTTSPLGVVIKPKASRRLDFSGVMMAAAKEEEEKEYAIHSYGSGAGAGAGAGKKSFPRSALQSPPSKKKLVPKFIPSGTLVTCDVCEGDAISCTCMIEVPAGFKEGTGNRYNRFVPDPINTSVGLKPYDDQTSAELIDRAMKDGSRFDIEGDVSGPTSSHAMTADEAAALTAGAGNTPGKKGGSRRTVTPTASPVQRPADPRASSMLQCWACDNEISNQDAHVGGCISEEEEEEGLGLTLPQAFDQRGSYAGAGAGAGSK